MSFKPVQSGNHILKFEQPADYWEESLLLGNSRIGLSLWGGIGRERIQLNHDTFWAGKPDPDVVSPEPGRLEFVRSLISEGRYTEAESILENEWTGNFTSPYQPMGELVFQYDVSGLPEDPSGYQRFLDIDSAVYRHSVDYPDSGFRTKAFVSYPASVAVLKFSTWGSARYSGSFEYITPYLPFGEGYDSAVSDGQIRYRIKAPHRYDGFIDQSDPDFSDTEGISGFTDIGISSADGSVRIEDDRFVIDKSSEFFLYIRTSTDWGKKDSGKSSEEIVAEAMVGGFDRLLQEHKRDYRSLFRKASLSIGSDKSAQQKPLPDRLIAYADSPEPGLIELLYNYGRYLLISSSRPGSQPANLQGIWNQKVNPPWWSNYTMNINTEMNYWGACVSGLGDCALPLYDYALRLMDHGSRTARQTYECSGWCSHHQSDLWASTVPRGRTRDGAVSDNAEYSLWPFSGIWLSLMAWHHFEYSRDRAFLDSCVKPLLQGSVMFLRDFLVLGDDGNLTSSPSTSPENRFIRDGKALAVSEGSTMDLSLAFESIGAFLSMSELIPCDRNLVDWSKSSLSKIKPFRIGKSGQLQEWSGDWDREEDHHRHQSHLFSVYPGESLLKAGMEEYRQAGERSLEGRGLDATGWSTVWKIALLARFGKSHRIPEYFRKLFQLVQPGDSEVHFTGSGSYPNLLCAHPPFQIDGNLGIVAAISEILMCQIDSDIELLPALPDEWAEGQITGLHTRGGLVIDISWNKRTLESVIISALTGGSWTIRWCGISTEIQVQEGDRIELDKSLHRLPVQED